MHYKDFTIYCCGSCLLPSSRVPNVAVAICTPLDWPEWLCQTYPPPCWAWSHLVWCQQHLHTLRVAGRNEPAGRSWARNLWLVLAAFKCESKRTMCVYLCLEMCVFTPVSVCWALSSPQSHTCMLVTSFLTLSLEETSTTATIWPCPLMLVCKLCRVSLADSSFMSATTTEAPSEAKRWHTARPIPLPPPGCKQDSVKSPELI